MQANHALAEAGRALHSRRMISGWGLYPRAASEILAADAPETLPALLRGRQGVIARGGGRAYGDAAVGLRATCLTGGLDRMRGFDPATGPRPA
jgi:decaprenylphospho-beta-D-ribofuranose 2-oxidase